MWMGGGEQGSSAPSLTGISSQFRYNALRFKQAGFPSDDGKTFWRSFPRFGIVERKNRGNEGGGDPRIFLDAKSRLASIYALSSPQEDLYRFLPRDVLTFPDEITPPSRVAHSLIHSAIIIGLPQPLRQVKATRVLLIS